MSFVQLHYLLKSRLEIFSLLKQHHILFWQYLCQSSLKESYMTILLSVVLLAAAQLIMCCCPSVLVCVIISCEQNISKSYERILLKFFGEAGKNPQGGID